MSPDEVPENKSTAELDKESLTINFAHEVATGFFALDIAVNEALMLVADPSRPLHPKDIEYLRRNLRVVRGHVDAQLFEATNFLAHAAPEFAAAVHLQKMVRSNPVEILLPMLPLYQQKAERRSIELKLDLPRGTPLPSFPYDELAMRRAFHNVLSNGLKYSYQGIESGWRFLKIWCHWVDARTQEWGISFQNYGIGIRPHEFERVFVPGYRGELAKRERTVGAGLGLAQLKRCVAPYGGSVVITSEPVHDETYVTTVTMSFRIP